MHFIRLLLIGLLSAAGDACTGHSVSVAAPGPVPLQVVFFNSGELSLMGVLGKPPGPGPFPVVVWNHGSEQYPGAHREGSPSQFDAIASIFVLAGYVVFAPVRRGQGRSEGRYIVDVLDDAQKLQGPGAFDALAVHLLETEQLDDQLAGLDYVKQLPYVDAKRIAVAGCSYGGIQTLLGIERHVGYRAGISLSPTAQSWDGNPLLRQRLIQFVDTIDVPVLLIQPPGDARLEPARVLGAEAARLGRPLSVHVYPAIGLADEQTHCFWGETGDHVWAAEARAFLDTHLRAAIP